MDTKIKDMTNVFLIPKLEGIAQQFLLIDKLTELDWVFEIRHYELQDYLYIVCNQTKEEIDSKFPDVKFVTKQGILTLKEFNNLPKYLWRPFKYNNAWFINEFPLFNTLISKCLYGREYIYHYNGHYFNTLEEAQEYCKLCIKKECMELLNYRELPEVNTDLISYVIVCDLLYGVFYYSANTDGTVKKRSMMLTNNPEKVVKKHCRKFLNYVK